MRCKNCGSDFEGNFCPHCGSKAIIKDITTCPICNTERNNNERFCVNCGYAYFDNFSANGDAEKRQRKINLVWYKIYRYFQSVGILLMGVIALLSLLSPVMKFSLLGFTESSETGFEVLAGALKEDVLITNVTIALTAVSVAILLYSVFLLIGAVKKPYFFVKNKAIWIIDGVLCLILLILGCIVSVTVAKEYEMDLGAGYALCISCGVIGLAILSARIIYEIKFFKLYYNEKIKEVKIEKTKIEQAKEVKIKLVVVVESGVTKDGIKWERYDDSKDIVITGCKGKIKDLIIPDIIEDKKVVAINRFAFDGCGFIRRAVIPQGIKRIESAAFMGCKNLSSVVMPSGLTRIGGLAFGNCKKLTSILIPQGVKEIGGLAFSRCKKLASIVIPQSVAKIGAYAFDRCDNLTIYYQNADLSTDNILKWDCNWNSDERPIVEISGDNLI